MEPTASFSQTCTLANVFPSFFHLSTDFSDAQNAHQNGTLVPSYISSVTIPLMSKILAFFSCLSSKYNYEETSIFLWLAQNLLVFFLLPPGPRGSIHESQAPPCLFRDSAEPSAKPSPSPRPACLWPVSVCLMVFGFSWPFKVSSTLLWPVLAANQARDS